MQSLKSFTNRLVRWFVEKPVRLDAAAILLLSLLWAFYFWRVITPNTVDQVSYPEGDFSGQFLAFSSYQASRLLAGEIPLWNPYNYAGHPFLADTQAAVFYPIRLAFILASPLIGGWDYGLLQLEVIVHYWISSVAVYWFVRTLFNSRLSGVISAIIFTYGGYLTGYPPLQSAVLEAGIWLPLALLGILKASQSTRWHPRWLILSAGAIGTSLLAGHPQTTLLLTYLVALFTLHRGHVSVKNFRSTAGALLLVFGVGYGLAAVQLLPGLEYMQRTIRSGFGYDSLANGFPFSDLGSFLFHGVVSHWSPLYSGIAALILAVFGFGYGTKPDRFWGYIAGISLLLSFGGATIIYRLAYLIAPGFAWFRGQERIAYVIAFSVAVLAGAGADLLVRKSESIFSASRRWIVYLTGLAWFFSIELLVARQIPQLNVSHGLVNAIFFTSILVTMTTLLLVNSSRLKPHLLAGGFIALVVFDLFSVTWKTNWEPVPADDRSLFSTALVDIALADTSLFRVDGRFGLGGNYGTMVGLQDIRGISPLRLNSAESYFTRLPEYRVYELLGVRYVFTDWEQLEIPSTIIATMPFAQANANLHEITEPRPRAWMTYYVSEIPDESQVLGLLSEPSFDIGSAVLVDEAPDLRYPDTAPTDTVVSVISYAAERIVVDVNSEADGILVLGEWYYPGWKVYIDGEASSMISVNGGLRAVPLNAGHHEVVWVYRPLSFTIGSGISLVSLLAGLVIIAGGKFSNAE